MARPSRASAASSARSTSPEVSGPPPWSAGEDDELTRALVERGDAVVGADDDVLDPGAAAAGQVDPRLDGERHPRLQRQGVARDDVGGLVGVPAHALPGAGG